MGRAFAETELSLVADPADHDSQSGRAIVSLSMLPGIDKQNAQRVFANVEEGGTGASLLETRAPLVL